MNIALIVATLITAMLLLGAAFLRGKGTARRPFWVTTIVGVILMWLVVVQVMVAILRH
jgi:hypothetical protein